jgi:hypothetical protein
MSNKHYGDSAALSSYIETALWSTNDNADDSGGEPLDKNYDASDLAPEALERMRADVDAFWVKGARAILSLEVSHTDEQIAHDFWLTRNGHGAGFWDGDYPEPQATILTDLAHSFSECDLYVGDDGKLYLA